MQQTAAERKIQWVWSDGTPAPVFKEFYRPGEHAAISEVNFRDPNMFVAGEIHNHLETWNVILQDYEDRGYRNKIRFGRKLTKDWGW